ncbi:MAG: PEP-CTERM sorting domain-containing protein [Bryobacterales bacterium]|nr:PEP-CTERM sorting domain-containing protein [Bryobacterales bacterium]
MNVRILLCAASLAALPTASIAVPVTWELSGRIYEANLTGALIDQAPNWADVNIGEGFRVLLGFDTDAALLRTRSGGQFAPGARYEYDPSSLSFLVQIGSRAPIEFEFSALAGTLFQLFWARDNSGDRASEGEGAQLDGYTMGVASDDNLLTTSVLMRGTVLDIVDGSALPIVPDSRLADLTLSAFFMNAQDNSGGFLSGDITSVRAAPTHVPEPSTLTLAAISLAFCALRSRWLKGCLPHFGLRHSARAGRAPESDPA